MHMIDGLSSLPRPPPVRSARVGGLVLSADRCSVSGVRMRWGWGLHLWGIWGEPGVGWSTPRVEKIQKRRFPYLPTPFFLRKTLYFPIVNLKNFPQKQKDPYKGSGFCVILALQALKGRNL
jgi:hypothetical protein